MAWPKVDLMRSVEDLAAPDVVVGCALVDRPPGPDIVVPAIVWFAATMIGFSMGEAIGALIASVLVTPALSVVGHWISRRQGQEAWGKSRRSIMAITENTVIFFGVQGTRPSPNGLSTDLPLADVKGISRHRRFGLDQLKIDLMDGGVHTLWLVRTPEDDFYTALDNTARRR